MARRKIVYEDPPVNSGMFLYCSLILIMLTFFVVLASMSVQDSRRQRLAIGSILGSFGVMPGGRSPFSSKDVRSLSPLSPPMDERPVSIEIIEDAIQATGRYRDIKVTRGRLGVTVTLPAAILFEDGTDRISPGSLEVLGAVANLLKRMDNEILVVGHTDSIPVDRPPYGSNWGLSGARALSVLSYFREKGVRPERMTAYGMGSTRPVADNETEEGRRTNSRVEIVMVGELPGDVAMEEKKGEAPERRPRSFFYRGYRIDLEDRR
ncbi:MAG TPA: OmpA family protein [Deltaproteobacteria bacterium]|nr:OmpA family protein [Deltaproteobacteria bacterium]HOM29557.1 OmpA family protein [Deltaproteobacteria bacterium]HPP81759.1 OmpA family protein [Deltaproteobacteria bacterium]